jgi:hypothetical protein
MCRYQYVGTTLARFAFKRRNAICNLLKFSAGLIQYGAI